MKLVVLESPNKTKTVKQYLNDQDYEVVSCNGHVTKLSKSGKYNLGVDLKTFVPRFIFDRSKKLIIDQLKKKALKAEEIYLATDPDREGEAISYHLAKLFPNHKIHRVFFNEITKDAVLNAFMKPTVIDNLLVESQIARRVLDRILGFRLSSFLQREINGKSAGRVQSVALKLIVAREKEIEKFVPTVTWELYAKFASNEIATFKGITTPKKQKKIIKKVEELQEIQSQLKKEYVVSKVVLKEFHLNEILPLKTSTLVSLAAQNFGFTSKKTMFIAQKLYEGIEYQKKMYPFITYPRTDSTRINDKFCKKIQSFIKKEFGNNYLKNSLTKKKINKSSLKIQDAHEAIRIVALENNLEFAKKILKDDLFKLYSLIYRYTLSSQMQSPKIATKKIILKNGIYYFELLLQKLLFKGYYCFVSYSQNDFVIEEIFSRWLPNQKEKASESFSKEKKTKPKPRFSEGALIKKMEFLGIGRPSTYVQISNRLLESNYLEQKKNILKPTAKGKEADGLLKSYFEALINEKYTAELENSLDNISKGKLERYRFLKEFWNFFDAKMKDAEIKMNDPKNENIKKCPKCESKMLYRKGRYGTFLSCSKYPDCKYIFKEKKVFEKLARFCPECQKILVKRQGKYGDFISCSGFPKCRFIERKVAPENIIDEKCPKCNEQLIQKNGRFGKFIACSGFPKCRYIQKNSSKKTSSFEKK